MDVHLRKKLLLLVLLRRRTKRRSKYKPIVRAKPRFWVRPIFQRRSSLGEHHRLVQELKTEDREQFFR